MTFSTLAMSCCAMGETSAGASFFAASIGSKVTFSFFSIGGEGMSMPLEFQKIHQSRDRFLPARASLFRSVFVLADGADTKGADDFVTVTRRHAERTADTGRRAPGLATPLVSVCKLQMVTGAPRVTTCPAMPLPTGMVLTTSSMWRRQPHLCHEMQQLFSALSR